MTLEEIKKIREEVGEDKAMMVVCDNEHIFYHNTAWSCPLIWDDDMERFISFEINPTTAQSQEKLPAKVVYTSYEHIQFIEVFATVADVIGILNKFKDKMTEEQYKYCIDFYSRVASSRMCKPGTLPLPAADPALAPTT